MSDEFTPALRPDLFGQLAATDPFQGRARRLFGRGQVLAVNGNQADLRVGYDAHNNPLELREVPVISGYVPRVGDWVSIQYEAGHSGAPWVTGPTMAADESQDSVGIGVFPVSSQEPSDPQKSTIYFDESAGTWRGWNGTAWVDIPTELHNTLTDLQGGSPDEYYHFSAAEQGALQDLCDGDGMASAYVERLLFKAVDTSATQRTRMFEKDGDFFWAINAAYNEQADQWNRIDTTKYAYLIALHSKNSIPTEPIGGVVWWRATPGANPIGAWAAVGGWELGYMMTEHRNFVMGGMNLEMDGSGSPPYGRLTQVGSEDTGNAVTAMQRNSWYEGSGQWGRDSHDRSSAIIGFDEDADLFVWWYPDSTEGNAPWNTSAWQQRAKLRLGGSIRGRLDVIRASGETNIGCSAFLSKHKTSGDMVDGFAAGYALAIEDSAGTENVIAAIYGVRAGADNTGRFSFRVASAGSLAERMSLTAAGILSITGASMNFAGNALAVEAASAINQDVTTDASPTFAGATFTGFPTTPSAAPAADYEVANKKYVDDNVGSGGAHASSHEVGGDDPVNHDSLTGFVSNEHINWTNTSSTLQTSGTGRFGSLTVNQGGAPTLFIRLSSGLLGVNAWEFYSSGTGWGKSYAFRSTGATKAITGSTSKGIDLGTSTRPFDDIYGDDFVNKGALDFSQADALALVKQHPSRPKPLGSADEYKSQFAHAGLYAKELDPASLPKELTGYYGLKEKFEKFTDSVWVQANIPTEDAIRDAKGKMIELRERPMTPAEAEAFVAEQQTLRKHPDDMDPQEWGISVNQMVSFNYRAIAQLLQRIEGIENQLAGLLARAG